MIATGFLSFVFSGNDMLEYPSIVSSVSYEESKERLMSSFDINKCVISIVFPKKTQ